MIEQILEKLDESQRIQLLERKDELHSLVCMMSFRPELKFEFGDPNSMWSFNFVSNVVSAPINELLEQSGDYCRGLTLHEAAHATVTRIFDMVNHSVFQRREVHMLFNCIEDCRIETWIQTRSPGAIPWIQEYNNILFEPIFKNPPKNSLCAQFCFSILCKWWFQKYPLGISEEIRKILEEIWPSIDKAIQTQPPRMEISSSVISQIYQESRTLRFAYLEQDQFAPPSDFEMLVRIRQLQMLHIVFQEIMPIYNQLIEQDTQNASKAQQDMKQFLSQTRGHHIQQSPQGQGENRQKSYEESQQGQNQQGQNQQAASRQFSTQVGNAQENIDAALRIDPKDRYLQAWQKLHFEIDYLSEQLIQVFQKTTKVTWLNGFPSGTRLDVRQAMAFEADPRKYLVLWQRKSRPKRINPCFTLLIDRSGSMKGERIDGAFRGMVLLSEVCARLSIPLEIFSFANNSTFEHEWEVPLNEIERIKLGRIPDQADGGTYLGNALERIVIRSRVLPFKDRFLIVLSDGVPHDGNKAIQQISILERNGVECIGLGVGPETSALKQFFSDGLFEVEPKTIALELAHIIRAKLID